MPRVPTYGTAKVRTAPLPSIRRTPQQEGAGVGLAIADMGDTIARTGLAFADRIVREEQEKVDTAALTAANRQLGDLESLLMTAPDSGALTSVKGKDVVGLKNQVLEKFDQQAGMIAANLTNDRQRLAFDGMKERRRQGVVDAVDAHTTRELATYSANEAKASIANALNHGIAYADDFNRVAEERARILGLLEANKVALGFTGPEQLEEAKLKTLSALHVGVLDKLIDTNQLARAKAYFEETRGEIEGDQIGNIEKALTVSNTKAEAQKAFDRINAEGGTYQEQRDKAKQIEDPDVRDATMAYLREEHAAQEQVKQDAQEERSVTVANLLDKGGGMKSIPATTLSAMPAQERNMWMDYAEKRANKNVAVKTDYNKLDALLTMAETNPDGFMELDIVGKYRPFLSDGDLEQMLRKRAEMRNGKSGTQIAATEGLIGQVIRANAREMFGPEAGSEAWRTKNPAASKRYDNYFQAVREAMDRDYPPSAGKRPTRADVQQRADELAAESIPAQSPWFGRNTAAQYAFETPNALSQIPLAERRKIEEAIVRQFGAPAVTPELILKMYEAKQAGAGR